MKTADETDVSGDSLLEDRIQELGCELYDRLGVGEAHIFQASFWQAKMMAWVIGDQSLKTDLFRLIDTLPSLQNHAQIARHAREYLLADDRTLPLALGPALRFTGNPLGAAVSSMIIKRSVSSMAESFIVGRDARRAADTLKKLWQQGYGFTVDLLGEATVNDAESQTYASRYADLIDYLPTQTAQWKSSTILDEGPTGPIPRTNISLKLSAMDHRLDAADPAGGVERLAARVAPLLRRAKELGAFINFDLEQWSLHEITYRLFERLVLDPEFASWPNLGIVVQTYLKRSGDDIDRLIALAKKRGTPLTVRLVKGAYWDYEVIQARLHGHECPVFTQKTHTDANYEMLAVRLLENRAQLQGAFGTHNLRSLASTLVRADSMGLRAGDFEIQMLFGMADSERVLLRELGHRVRLYAPVGDLLTGMAYLVRRLLENTSNTSFLRRSRSDAADVADLMGAPIAAPRMDESPPGYDSTTGTTFRNCSLADFANPAKSLPTAFAIAIAQAEREMPWQVPVVVNGKPRTSGATLSHLTPNDRTRVATQTVSATLEDLDTAIASAKKAWPAWRDLPLETRAARVRDLGDRLESDRLALMAREVHEQAKPWREADADVAEAVDFCHYYARQAMLEISPRLQGNLAGEINTLTYEGRGLTAVIAPWNFPLAILCGMATAALVAGNAVLLKPAEQATGIAHAFHQHAIAAGIPPEILQFLPGDGAVIGAALVRHPDVVQIAFTGSREVGTAILKQAAEIAPGQTSIKRVVCEMGGKNAIIVDDDADLDEAVGGVIQSAFGYAGQKCSACSRVIVVGNIRETFLSRLHLAAEAVVPMSAVRPDCPLPPVIDEASYAKLWKSIREPGPGARAIHVGAANETGWFVPPALFEVDDPRHRLMQEELFGPVVAVFFARDFDHALAVANDSMFALTGAVFSRSPVHLQRARESFRVGNLYLNRGCTGALVDRQPFGGFKMSGAGTKAGGPGYLLHFVDMHVCTENTMRRGFAPDLAE